MKRICKRLISVFAAAVLVIACSLCFAGPARSDGLATDDLSVYVGYVYMNYNDYIPVGTYNWAELEQNLPIYDAAYSYFSGGDNWYDFEENPTAFKSVVASARGFYLEDLLNYANIYKGDIYNLLFFVEDTQGIWYSPDYSEMFATQYYFEDFPDHVSKIRDEEGNITGIDENDTAELWANAYEVWPMLAIESNWEWFSAEAEHSWPNFENMGTSTRFHLLFGQEDPFETETQDSAKYVSRVYVTLYGEPSFVELDGGSAYDINQGNPLDMDMSIGSHTVEFYADSGSGSDIRDVLSQYISFQSNNENILEISGWDVVPDSDYSNISRITINYEVKKEDDGSASIFGGFGGLQGLDQYGSSSTMASDGGTGLINLRTGENGSSYDPDFFSQAPIVTEEPTPEPTQEPTPEITKEPTPEPTATATPTAEPTATAAPTAAPTATTAPSNTPVTQTASATPAPADTGEITELAEEAADLNIASDEYMLQNADALAVDASVFNTGRWKISQSAAEKFNNERVNVEQKSIRPDTAIAQLEVTDTSERDKQRERMVLIYTLTACLGICVIGGLAEAYSFRYRLSRPHNSVRSGIKAAVHKKIFGEDGRE